MCVGQRSARVRDHHNINHRLVHAFRRARAPVISHMACPSPLISCPAAATTAPPNPKKSVRLDNISMDAGLWKTPYILSAVAMIYHGRSARLRILLYKFGSSEGVRCREGLFSASPSTLSPDMTWPTSAAQLLPDSLSRRNNNFHQLSSLFLRRDPREILMALEPKITRSGAVEVETE